MDWNRNVGAKKNADPGLRISAATWESVVYTGLHACMDCRMAPGGHTSNRKSASLGGAVQWFRSHARNNTGHAIG